MCGSTPAPEVRSKPSSILPSREHTNAHPHGQPIHDDFLEGARAVFNVALGTAESPSDGDTRVYCVCMGKVVIGVYEKVRQYSQRVMENHDFVGVELKKSA